jgi:hypothetical protein
VGPGFPPGKRSGCGFSQGGAAAPAGGKLANDIQGTEGTATMTLRVPTVSLERARELGEAMGMPARLGDPGMMDPTRRHVARGSAGMAAG